MMMATSIMVSIFSTHDHPAAMLSHVFCGASFGVAAAFLCRLFLLPIDPARRLRSILIAIVHDLNSMAVADSLMLVKKCRDRTHHRVLRMLANAAKLDHDLSAVVEGGLATLAIGRYLQRLRENEMQEGISLAASGAVRNTALILSTTVRKPEEILSVLRDASGKLSIAMEAHPVDGRAAVQQALSVASDVPFLPKTMLLARSKESPCHI